jgi:hypothetical protein
MIASRDGFGRLAARCSSRGFTTSGKTGGRSVVKNRKIALPDTKAEEDKPIM